MKITDKTEDYLKYKLLGLIDNILHLMRKLEFISLDTRERIYHELHEELSYKEVIK